MIHLQLGKTKSELKKPPENNIKRILGYEFSKSLMGGVIFVIPITLTIDLRAPKIEPRTSGYSSPRYSYKTTPR